MNPDRFRGLSWNLKEQLFNDKTKFLQFFDVKESVVYFFFFFKQSTCEPEWRENFGFYVYDNA